MISTVGALRGRWRSWFWNIFGSLCAFVFFGLSLAVTLNGGDLISRILFSPVVIVSLAGIVRCLTMGVTARPEVLVIRELYKTYRIAWSDIDRFSCDRGHWREINAPVVHLRRSLTGDANNGEQSMSIMSLGAYGLITFGKSLPERATEGLNEHLRRYRATHPES